MRLSCPGLSVPLKCPHDLKYTPKNIHGNICADRRLYMNSIGFLYIDKQGVCMCVCNDCFDLFRWFSEPRPCPGKDFMFISAFSALCLTLASMFRRSPLNILLVKSMST